METATKIMDHGKYQRMVKKMDTAALLYTIEECKEVIEIQKSFNPNCGYYADEIHYCAAELRRRQPKASCPTCGK